MLPKRTGRESPTRAAPRGRDAPFAIPPLTPPPFPAFPAFLAFLAFFSLAATGGFVPGLFAPALFAQIPDGTGAPGEAETPSATETNPADENNAGQIVIDSERIARMKVNKVEDVLNQAPGVSASSSSVSVHGSSKVRVFLDGTPLNDPTSSYGAVNLDHISLNSVDRIVIVKDAGGLHYGHDATGGVILIHTKNFAENRNTGQIRLWAGNHDSYRGDADLMFARGPWSLGVKGGYETTRGYKINNDSTRRRGGARVSRSFGENGTASLAVDLLTEETGFSGLPAFPTPHSRQWSRNLALTQGTTWGGYSNNLYFNRGNVKNKDPSRGLDQELTVSEYGDSLSNERPLGPGTLTLGLGYRGISADSSEFGKHSESSFHFLAAQSVETPSFPLTLKAGIRANLNSAFENTFNPEFSVGYGNPKFRALYKISLGANLPSFQQRFGRSASTDPNPGLGPEKGLNQSLGLDWFPFDFLTLNLTLFHNRLKGRISYVRPVDSGIGKYENLGSTVYQGFDAGFVAKIGKPVELKVGYTFLDARDKDIGKFLTSRPRHSVLAELTFRAGDTFSLTLKADGESKSYTDRMNTATLAPRTLFGLRAEKSFGNLVIFFDGTNIFDKEYYYVDGLLAPPRVFHLGTKYNFQ